MKKISALIILGLLTVSMLFSRNYQKVYSVDDSIRDDISSLSVLSGLSLPSTTGPWSGEELKSMLDKIDTESLSGYGQQLYESIMSRLESDASLPVFSASLEVDPELYIQTDTSSKYFLGRDNWVRGWDRQKSAVNINTEEHIGSSFYGFFDFSLGVAKDWKSGDDTSRSFGDSTLWSNIPFLLANNMKQLDFNFPLRAFVAAGGEHWLLFVGRDRLSWGNGKTGNFVIGDQIKYHNAAFFKAFDGNFRYTFLVSAFPHPQNYYTEIKDEKGNVTGMQYSVNGTGGGQSHYMNGISCFIAHRLEWNILPSLSFTLTEGVMYMSKDNRIDLIAFAPAMMYHNNYTRSNTNSILSFEIDWTITKGLNVYGQVVVDESVLPGENNPLTTSELAEPNGLGFLLGVTYKTVLKCGILTLNAEGAYTDPYLYLRDGDQQAGEAVDTRQQTNGRYGINYVVAIREMSDCGGTENYNLDYLGYRYGGDAIVALLSGEYSTSKWNAGLNLFFMIHGTHDKYTAWTRVNDTVDGKKMTNKTTPTTQHQTANSMDADADKRDSASVTFVTSLYGSYSFFSFLSASAEVDFIYLKNPGNISTNPSLFNVQTTLSMSYTWK
jgi:hypothetical protein